MSATEHRKRLPHIVNSVLAYGHVRLKYVSPEEVCESLASTFEGYEFRAAKDELWQNIEEKEGSDGIKIIGQKQNRNNSCSRTAARANCQDVLKALKDLEDAGILPDLAVCVEDLVELPHIAPQLELSHQKRRAACDSQLSEMEEELHQTQTLVQESLASIQEAQKTMAADLVQLRQRLDAPAFPGTRSTPSCQQKPRSTRSVSASHPEFEGADRVVHDELGPRGSRSGYMRSIHPKSEPPAWSTVKRRKKKRKIVTGTQECVDSFCGAPEVRSLFVWNVSKDTEPEKVKKHIANQCDGIVSVRAWSHPDAPRRSFKVTVMKESVNTLMNPDFPWPRHVKVRHFVPGRGPPPVHVKL